MKRSNKWDKSAMFFSGWLVICLSAFIHPVGVMKAQKSHQPLLDGAQMDEGTFNLLQRSCQDCHSDRTQWPWYSYVVPFSWLVEKDVRDGRNAFDMSNWSSYSVNRKQEILAQISSEVRNKRMPQPKYTLLHRNAKLGDKDIAALYEWAHSERRRLKTVGAIAKAH